MKMKIWGLQTRFLEHQKVHMEQQQRSQESSKAFPGLNNKYIIKKAHSYVETKANCIKFDQIYVLFVLL